MTSMDALVGGMLAFTFLVILHLLAESSSNFSQTLWRTSSALKGAIKARGLPVPQPSNPAPASVVMPEDVGQQYKRIARLKKQIRQFRVEGKSEGEITLLLRKRGWDPQIVSLSLRRMRR